MADKNNKKEFLEVGRGNAGAAFNGSSNIFTSVCARSSDSTIYEMKTPKGVVRTEVVFLADLE